MIFGMQMHATFILKCSKNVKCFESWKLCNAHDILSYFCGFNFDLIFLLFFFLWKTQIDYLFLKDVITHEISSYLFANLFGDSLRVYVLFDLVTWQFCSDGNGVIWNLINQPFLFLFKTFYYFAQQGNIRLWYVTKWNFPDLRS